MRKTLSPFSKAGSEMPAVRKHWCTFVYFSVVLIPCLCLIWSLELDAIQALCMVALRHLCGFRLYFFMYRQWSCCQELQTGAQELFSSHNSVPVVEAYALTPALLTCLNTSCWASVTHTALLQLNSPPVVWGTGMTAPAGRHMSCSPSYRWGNWGTEQLGFGHCLWQSSFFPRCAFPVSVGKKGWN